MHGWYCKPDTRPVLPLAASAAAFCYQRRSVPARHVTAIQRAGPNCRSQLGCLGKMTPGKSGVIRSYSVCDIFGIRPSTDQLAAEDESGDEPDRHPVLGQKRIRREALLHQSLSERDE